MDDFKHLDLKKVGVKQLEELLRVARLQGQWTATKSLQRQAQQLGTTGPILKQFEVHLESVEKRLPKPHIKKEDSNRLSWEWANGIIPPHMVIHHTCDNRLCVNPSHLELRTYKENTADAIAKGRHHILDPKDGGRGERHQSHKLTNDQVREIRKLYKPKIFGCRKLARKFGVSHDNIMDIVNRKTWKHI